MLRRESRFQSDFCRHEIFVDRVCFADGMRGQLRPGACASVLFLLVRVGRLLDRRVAFPLDQWVGQKNTASFSGGEVSSPMQHRSHDHLLGVVHVCFCGAADSVPAGFVWLGLQSRAQPAVKHLRVNIVPSAVVRHLEAPNAGEGITQCLNIVGGLSKRQQGQRQGVRERQAGGRSRRAHRIGTRRPGGRDHVQTAA